MKNTLSGRIIRGDNYGKRLGFPTANLDRRQYSRDRLKIKFGVYAGWAILPGGRQYRAGIVIGPRDRSGLPKLEAHLIGFAGNLYGKKIILRLIKFLRPYRSFSTQSLLKQQITHDISIIKRLKIHE